MLKLGRYVLGNETGVLIVQNFDLAPEEVKNSDFENVYFPKNHEKFIFQIFQNSIRSRLRPKSNSVESKV